jgi:hypothetical protein
MERFARRCDATGRGINEGYVVGDGELYFSEEKHLIDHLREYDWIDSNGKSSKDIEDDAKLMEFFYNEDYYYYTEWDEVDEDEWYDADGNLHILDNELNN